MLSVSQLDDIANYFYLKGYLVGRVRDLKVTVNEYGFESVDPYNRVSAISINRFCSFGQTTEIIVNKHGVVYLLVDTEEGEKLRIHIGKPTETQKGIVAVIERLISMNDED